MAKVTTIHIKDAVSKTFHIAEHEIILHVDINALEIKVDERHRDDLLAMIQIGRNLADDVIEDEDDLLINVHGDDSPMLGEEAQRIWEESILK